MAHRLLRPLAQLGMMAALVCAQTYPKPDDDLWAFAALDPPAPPPSVPAATQIADITPPPPPPPAVQDNTDLDIAHARATILTLLAAALVVWLIGLLVRRKPQNRPEGEGDDVTAARDALRQGHQLLQQRAAAFDHAVDMDAVAVWAAAATDACKAISDARAAYPLLPPDLAAMLTDCERALLASVRARVVRCVDASTSHSAVAGDDGAAGGAAVDAAEALALQWLVSESRDAAIAACRQWRSAADARQAAVNRQLMVRAAADDDDGTLDPQSMDEDTIARDDNDNGDDDESSQPDNDMSIVATPGARALALASATDDADAPHSHSPPPYSPTGHTITNTPLAAVATALQAQAGPGEMSREAALLKAADLVEAQRHAAAARKLQLALHRDQQRHERRLQETNWAQQRERDEQAAAAAREMHAASLRLHEQACLSAAASAREALLDRRRVAAAAVRAGLEDAAARCDAEDAAAARATITLQLACLAGLVLAELATAVWDVGDCVQPTAATLFWAGPTAAVDHVLCRLGVYYHTLARLVLGVLTLALYGIFAYVQLPGVGLCAVVALAGACVRDRAALLIARPLLLAAALAPTLLPVAWLVVAQAATQRRLQSAIRALRYVDEPLPFEQAHVALRWRVGGVNLREFPITTLVPALFLVCGLAAALAAVAPQTAGLIYTVFSW